MARAWSGPVDKVRRGACAAVVLALAACSSQPTSDESCFLGSTQIVRQPADQSGAVGDTVHFVAEIRVADLTGQLRSSWDQEAPDRPIPFAPGKLMFADNITINELSVEITQALDGARFSLRYYAGPLDGTCRNSSRERRSGIASLTVQGPPVINTHPQSGTIAAGEDWTFTVSASGTGLTYQWQKNGSNLAGATEENYEILDAQVSDAGTYRVVVSNAAGSDTSNAAMLTVTQNASVITWTGDAGTTDWFDAGNWDLERTPLATDTVVIDDADSVRIGSGVDEPNVQIARLRHTAGTLRLVGPPNCPNCANLYVTAGVASSGATARIEVAQGVLRPGAASTIADLVELNEGENAAGGLGVVGAGTGRVAVALGKLVGRSYFVNADVTLSGSASLEGGLSLNNARFTVLSSASADVGQPRAGREWAFASNFASDTLVIEGTLRTVDAMQGIEFRLPVRIGATGLIEFSIAKFVAGMDGNGELNGVSGNRILSFLSTTTQPVTFSATSSVSAVQVDFDAPTSVGGRLTASRVNAARRAIGQVRSFTVSDASRLDVGALSLGAEPVTLSTSTDVSGIDGLFATSGTIEFSGGGNYAVRRVELRGVDLQATGAPVRFDSDTLIVQTSGGLPTILRSVEIANARHAVLNGAIRGANGARLILAGTNTFQSATLSALVAGMPGSLYVHHLGSFQATGGASQVQACITTGGAASILPPVGSATLTLLPLPPEQCP